MNQNNLDQLNTLLKSFDGKKNFFQNCTFFANQFKIRAEINLYFGTAEQFQLCTFVLDSSSLSNFFSPNKFYFENVTGFYQIYNKDKKYGVEIFATQVEINFYNEVGDIDHQNLFIMNIKVNFTREKYDQPFGIEINEIKEQILNQSIVIYSVLDNKAFTYSLIVSLITIIQIIGSLILNNIFKDQISIARQFSSITFELLLAQDIVLGTIHYYFSQQNIWFLFPLIFELIQSFLLSILIIKIIVEEYYPLKIYFFSKLFLPIAIITILLILCFYLSYEVFIIALNLFLLPQIYHLVSNVEESQFCYSFVLFILSNRIIIPIYLCCCPFNFLSFQASNFTSIIVLLIFCTQVIIYTLQCQYGTKFFIPLKYQSKNHNYFVIKNSTEECSICFQSLKQRQYYIVQSQNPKLNYMLFRNINMQMKTPCKHYFHSVCLIIWMTIQMSCPLCRSRLPSIL
ncbi:unnamed protein product [Paramecium sonneborni]|uniref:RING-type E3 ubiquitin transferase n=1 Tax=Paramecium sonneborni TaxID=65129 RepID=A0A8S1R549_9CILI|nr:unnamed protein product [Paramecium sonneborni]